MYILRDRIKFFVFRFFREIFLVIRIMILKFWRCEVKEVGLRISRVEFRRLF